jgi:hypothetical protein
MLPGFDESLQIVEGRGRMRHQQLLQKHQHRHRDEIALRVVRQLRVEVRVDGERRVGGHQDGVTVRRRLRHRVGGEDGVRARPVLDHHRLSPHRGELVGELPRHDVDAAARGIGDHDAHRLGRPGVHSETGERKGEGDERFHGVAMIS